MSSQPVGPPRTVGPYTLLTRIGEGGMGVVHLAADAYGHRVALKMLRQHIVGDEEARQRLAREVSSLERVRSRWVAEIIDADPWAEVPYVATRYVPGLSLHDHVHTEGRIEGADLLWFAACLAEGLSSVHAAGVLHRDVKPSNVLMEGRTPILIDFGLARVADDPKLTHTGWLLGTPGYLAPEILYGDDATAASDVHSWAATVAFAATARAPFGRGPSMAIMDRVRRGQFDLDGIGQPLRDVIASCLDPEPDRRPSLDAVLAWLRPQTTLPLPTQPAAPAVPDRPTVVRQAATVVLPDETDPFTMALDVANSSAAPVAPTRVEPPVAPVAPVVPTVVERTMPPPAHLEPLPLLDPSERPERVPVAQRVRRVVLVGVLVLALTAVLAAVPWIALGVVVLGTWLLRSGSLAAEDVSARRAVRGRKWYDGVLLLVHAPWRVVQGLPGTLALLLWSLGLAAAAGLIAYAADARTTTALAACSAVFSLALWFGPGAARVRSPLSRVVNPASRTTGWWLIAVGSLLVVALGAGTFTSLKGPVWAPDDDRPLTGVLH